MLNHSSSLQRASRDAKESQESARSLRHVTAAVYRGLPTPPAAASRHDAPDAFQGLRLRGDRALPWGGPTVSEDGRAAQGLSTESHS